MINLIEDTEDHHYYFTYHHSAGDSITMMSEEDLDSNVFGIASIFYLLASSEQSLPLPNINQAKLNEYINNYRNAQ